MSLRPLAVPLFLAALTAVTAVPPTPAGAAEPARQVEAGLIARIDDERAERGLRALDVTADLTAVARAHSATMARSGSLKHNADLSGAVDGWRWLGENIAFGGGARELHHMLMTSPPHRRILLRADADELGVGVAVRDGRVWVTQVLRRSN